MSTFLKYFGAICLLTIAASLAFCSFGVYNGIQTANRLFAGADNYTCRQFAYDLQQEETDKLPALLIAAAAYGMRDVTPTGPQAEATEGKGSDTFEGLEPAIRKVYTLCEGQPNQRVLNLFAQSITGVSATAPVATPSGTIPSSTTPQPAQ